MDRTEKEIGANRSNNQAVMAAVRKIAGGVAHDLNNMLTGVFGFLALMKDGTADMKESLGYLADIEKNAGEIKIFADKLILLSMNGDPVRSSFDISALLKETVLGEGPGSNGISQDVKADITGTLLFEGDRAALAFAFTSIIRRMSKALSKTGRIDVSAGIKKRAHDAKESVCIRFGFSGASMPLEKVLGMFEPLYTSFRDNSLGYELILANEIVLAHEGEMRFYSCGEGAFDLEIELPVR